MTEQTPINNSPEEPSILYKYMKFDDAVRVLDSQELLFSAPFRFNDHFDCEHNIHYPLLTSESHDLEISLLTKALVDPSSWPASSNPVNRGEFERRRQQTLNYSESEIVDYIRLLHLSKSQGRSLAVNLLNERSAATRSKMRVLCLTSSCKCELMWSHYAASNTGIVLGFDKKSLDCYLPVAANKVIYSTHRTRLIDPGEWIRSWIYGLQYPGLDPEKFRSSMYRKSKVWEYEKEYRYILNSIDEYSATGMSFKTFPTDCLVSLITGIRVDSSSLSRLIPYRDKYPECNYYKCTQTDDNYGYELLSIKR